MALCKVTQEFIELKSKIPGFWENYRVWGVLWHDHTTIPYPTNIVFWGVISVNPLFQTETENSRLEKSADAFTITWSSAQKCFHLLGLLASGMTAWEF